MRTLSYSTLLGTIFAMAVMLPSPVVAQVDDGCVQSNPCALTVDLDSLGIASISQVNFTSGDWFQLSAYNDDDKSHTVTVQGHGITLTVAAVDIEESQPFAMGAAGTYTLRDEPTGDTVTLTVLAGDVVDYENGAASSSKDGIPGPALPLVALGLLAAVALRRR